MCNFIFLCPSNSLKCSKAIRLHVSKRQFFGSINILISPGLGDICQFFPLDVCSHNGPHWHHWVKKKIQVPKSVLLKCATARFVSLCCHVIWQSAWVTVQCIKRRNLANFSRAEPKPLEVERFISHRKIAVRSPGENFLSQRYEIPIVFEYFDHFVEQRKVIYHIKSPFYIAVLPPEVHGR